MNTGPFTHRVLWMLTDEHANVHTLGSVILIGDVTAVHMLGSVILTGDNIAVHTLGSVILTGGCTFLS